MAGQYIRKIDPLLLNSITLNSGQKTRAIIYTALNVRHAAETLAKMENVRVLHLLPIINACAVEVERSKLYSLARLDWVEYLCSDVEVSTQMHIATRITNVRLWHNAGYTGKGVGIAFIDTGIFPHPDFLRPGNRIRGFVDFLHDKKIPYDDNGHGTFMAGVAAGSGYGSRGMYRGIAPQANIYALKCVDHNGNGTAASVLKGMQWVADNCKSQNIKVLSMSIGAPVFGAARDDAMVRGAERLWKMGVTVVAAAGNEGPGKNTITVPGNSGTILTVGAVDDARTEDCTDDCIPDFSSRGPVGRRIKPDIVAPGVDIVSLSAKAQLWARDRRRRMETDYTTMTGTSVATPMVAGMAALLCQRYPEITPDQIKRTLMTHARRVAGDLLSEGRGMAVMPV